MPFGLECLFSGIIIRHIQLTHFFNHAPTCTATICGPAYYILLPNFKLALPSIKHKYCPVVIIIHSSYFISGFAAANICLHIEFQLGCHIFKISHVLLL